MTSNQWLAGMGLAGLNDAFQTRKPDGSFFHGFSYGLDATSIFPQFPAELGGNTAKNLLGRGENQSINYLYGKPSDINSYNRVAATIATPGAPNSPENASVINNIKNGTFDYTDWANPRNWNAVSLPLYIHSFSGIRNREGSNELFWSVSTTEDWSAIILEKSIDGKNFITLNSELIEKTQMPIMFRYTDVTEDAFNIYRLHIKSSNGEDKYSKSILIRNEVIANKLSIYPNPVGERITVSYTFENDLYAVCIRDLMGNVLVNEHVIPNTKEHQINTNNLHSGIYYLQLIDINGAIIKSRKFTKL